MLIDYQDKSSPQSTSKILKASSVPLLPSSSPSSLPQNTYCNISDELRKAIKVPNFVTTLEYAREKQRVADNELMNVAEVVEEYVEESLPWEQEPQQESNQHEIRKNQSLQQEAREILEKQVYYYIEVYLLCTLYLYFYLKQVLR